jgi:hypothetical protein
MRRFVFSVLLAASVVPSLSANVQSWEPEWEAFRTAYPYHIQVIALSQPNAAGNRLLILSEPPPSLGAQDIRELEPAAFASMALFRHPIGVDGWVQDAAIELNPLSDRQLAALVDDLHVKLFGTAYKAMAVSIPHARPRANADYKFDLHVSAGRLKRWLVPDSSQSGNRWLLLIATVFLAFYGARLFGSKRGKRHALALILASVAGYQAWGSFSRYSAARHDQVLFMSPFSPEPTTVADLLSKNARGVFYSKAPGLVLWLIPKGVLTDSARPEIRRFALDSDVILGSVGNPSTVAIVARERVAPIDILPPLRTETIIQLATVKDTQLAQSYERTHVFAGKFDGRHDWAPIYLSDELIDTEYGSLLNITDQLLKSWSMAGRVRYLNFDYPDPQHFPFPKPLSIWAHANEITFNWNTKGAGYSSRFGPYDVFAWTRTGALPVDYLGNKNALLHSAEDTGYEYFATRNDPNLVRVVQYAEIYQIFRHYGMSASGPGATYNAKTPEVFLEQTRALLERFSAIPDEEIQRHVNGDEARRTLACKHALVQLRAAAGEPGMEKIVFALAAPRAFGKQLIAGGATSPDSLDGAIARLAASCQETYHDVNSLAPMTLFEIMQAYVIASHRPATGWIHTPSIVISEPHGEVVNATGGHNLDSAATILRPSSALESGQVKVVEEDGQNVLEYSSKDTDKIQQSIRTVAREEDKSAANLEAKAREVLASAKPDTRSFAESLNLTGAHRPSLARGFEPEHAPAYAEKAGWWTGGAKPSNGEGQLVDALNSKAVHTIVIERNGNAGYNVFDGPRQQIIHASTKPGTVDAVYALLDSERTPRGDVHLHFRGFDPREAKGFVQTARLHAENGAHPPDFTATVDDSKIDPAELKVILSEKYNFHEVSIQRISDPFLDTEGRTAIDVEASVKAANANKPSLLVRIRIVLKEGIQMTADLLATIKETILQAFSLHPGAFSDDSIRMTATFVKSLEKAHPGIHSVEVKVTKEGKDVYIVRDQQIGRDAVFAG